ncbi:MAG TPA: high frequency lysogenization protein HflD [Frankiaceae bacterium]|nr:high frequency lysogenization protein HflD [Frankiaceae bacterium]
MRRLLAVLCPAAFLVLTGAGAASAHPLGNFTVNTHAGLVAMDGSVSVAAVVDYAEIPAIRERQAADTDRDARVSDVEAAAYAARACADAVPRLALTADGAAVALRVVSSTVTFPPGAADLPTVRVSCRLAADVETVGRTLALTSRWHTDRVGWREVVATGDGVALARSDVPARSSSAVLTAYPEDLLASPLDQRTATVRVERRERGAGSGVAALPPSVRRAPGVDRLTAAFEALATREELSFGFALLALLACVGLGAAHAFAPGHGKTVMAAYLVGRGGNLRHAGALGLSVTVTHTVGVLVLGVALSTASLVAPERLYPLLGLFSGVLVVAIGGTLLWRAAGLRDRLAHARAHRRSAPHDHPHHDHAHPAGEHAGHDDHAHGHEGMHRHGGRSHRHDLPVEPGLRGVLALGLAGGLVPSPSALVVLLGAIALGRAWFGVLLVVAYGIGMAMTLIGVGLLLVRTRGTLSGWAGRRTGWFGRGVAVTAAVLPVLTAAFVVVVGVGLTVQAAVGV